MNTNKITRGLVFFFFAGLFCLALSVAGTAAAGRTAHMTAAVISLLLIALGSLMITYFVAAEISEILKYLDEISKRLEKIESVLDAGKDNKDKKQDEGAK